MYATPSATEALKSERGLGSLTSSKTSHPKLLFPSSPMVACSAEAKLTEAARNKVSDKNFMVKSGENESIRGSKQLKNPARQCLKEPSVKGSSNLLAAGSWQQIVS